MAIKGILFDKDGTLIEFNGFFGLTYLKMLQQHFGHSPEEALAMLVVTGFVPETGSCRSGSPMASETMSQIARRWWPNLPASEALARAKVMDDNFDRAALQKPKAVTDLADVFHQLAAANYILGVATNDSEASAHAHMTHFGVVDHFELLIGADSVADPKPSGDMIRHFAQVTGLAPHEIAMVGDNAHDINEARAGGAGLAIGVLSGNSDHDDLAHIADHVIGTVAELPLLLKRLS
ncbi:MAG: HAD family hydrolase [Pseudomonadota bacterium]|nr:HAD family hydrolase [Pseudomonadota bacterium]